MNYGFVKVAAVTPKVKVADTKHNGQEIRRLMNETAKAGAKVVVFPELCVTGFSCGDLFLQDQLIKASLEELLEIAKESNSLDAIFFVGLPYEMNGKLYNVVAAVSHGEVLGIVPKVNIVNYGGICEGKYFASGKDICVDEILPNGQMVSIDCNQVFYCEELPKLKVAAEICEDMWVSCPPSTEHANAGANIIVNAAASSETVGKRQVRRDYVKNLSSRLICGYLYASAGEGESTQDVVYSGHNLIAEEGSLLAESKPLESGIVYSEVDVFHIENARRNTGTFDVEETHTFVPFHLEVKNTVLSRKVDASPFIPDEETALKEQCEEILMIQAMGLKKRMEHTWSKTAVIGISGGLDSTLALLVTAKTFDLLGLDRSGIHAITMPGFGTTDRTYDNALKMIQALGCSFREISIKDAVNQHFKDIEQRSDNHDVTYENAQARERTQILMDVANQVGGMVIGTGDLSELVLGWATYNGDHMSNYGVNGSIPKTLVRHLVRFYADSCKDELLAKTLYDVLDTPVSPELLPPSESGDIKQKTEDLVGPYELHDFSLYHMLKNHFAPAKIYHLACIAFQNEYEPAFILKWLKTFYRRFFTQQFKRSCLPDGPQAGVISVSPRGALSMPSDACARIWIDELENL